MDTTNDYSMCNSSIEVVNFDKLPKEFPLYSAIAYNESNSQVAKEHDMYMIEAQIRGANHM